jgi:hypothetical protein
MQGYSINSHFKYFKMFNHGSATFVIRNRSTGKTENIRRNHNWYQSDKHDYSTARKKEAAKLKKAWNERPGRYDDCLSVSVY